MSSRNVDGRSASEQIVPGTPNSNYDLFLKKQPAGGKDVAKTFPDRQIDNNINAIALPNEMWLKIFANLSYGDLLQVHLVCKHWRQLSRAELKRKGKLVITSQNLEDICILVEYENLKYENVEIRDEIDDKLVEFSNAQHALLLRVFNYLGKDIVRVKLFKLSTLFLLNNLLPKLRDMDLSSLRYDRGVWVNLNKFSNLKSLLMPYNKLSACQLSWTIVASNQLSLAHLEKLDIGVSDSVAYSLDVIVMCASSLHWLKLRLGTHAYLALKSKLIETFQKLTRLKVLDIGCTAMEAKRTILENIPKESRLRAIMLGSDGVDDDLLELIGRKWSTSLKCLHLKSNKITRNTVKQLNFLNGNLRSLQLSWNCPPPRDLLPSIVPKVNKTLTEIELFGTYLCGDSFCAVAERLPNLKKLGLNFSFLAWRMIVDYNLHLKRMCEEMCSVFQHLTRLRHLAVILPCDQNNINYLCSQPNISNLKRLKTLKSCLFPIKTLQILNLKFTFKELIKLQLNSCQKNEKLSGLELVDISKYFPALEELRIVNFDCDHNAIQGARNSFPRLRRLQIVKIN
uniref:F-box domain-containing protein n=1 Tax=Glossina austeni TaxID=7395 RepID=A0A1A9UL07_GLOAU